MMLGQLADRICAVPFTVFAGAGVSFESGFPLVAQLTSHIMDCLSMNREEKTAVDDAKLPFERFVETIAQISKPDLLYRIFEGGRPNIAHEVCTALLAQRFAPAIVTTNFDTLFEKACTQSGVSFEKYWHDSEIGAVNWHSPSPKLIKMHGCVEDLQSLAITIRRVANQRNIDERSLLIAQVFGGRVTPRVLVMGYSGSDRFDINPALNAIDSNRSEVMLITHSHGSEERVEICDLLNHPSAGPFARFPGSLIRCETGNLLRAIGSRVGYSNSQNPKHAHSWRAAVTDWIGAAESEYGSDWAHLAAGYLMSTSYAPELANRRLSLAAVGDTTPLTKYRAKQKMSDNFRDTHKLLEAKANIKTALKWAKLTGKPEAIARCFLNWGVIRADEKKFAHAIRHYDRATQLANASNAEEILLTALGNKAIALKNIGGEEKLREALVLHEQALALARKLGDKRSEGRELGNIGITYSNLHDVDSALKYYRIARQVALDLGDKIHVAIWMANEGKDILGSDRNAADHLLRGAAALFSEIGNDNNAKLCISWLEQESSPDESG